MAAAKNFFDSLGVKDFPDGQIVEIAGVRYSYDFFRQLGKDGLPAGDLFLIIQRNDSAFLVKRVGNEEGLKDYLEHARE